MKISEFSRKRLKAKEIAGVALILAGWVISGAVSEYKGSLRFSDYLVDAVYDGDTLVKDLGDGSRIEVKRIFDK